MSTAPLLVYIDRDRMKLTTLAQSLLIPTILATAILSGQIGRSQIPPVIDNSISDEIEGDGTTIAAGSTLRVSCQDLKTVVRKGDRQAVMFSWNYDGFGKDFAPAKRCQMVSERLQQAANRNGGTFKDLELASGKVNSLTVICAVRSNRGNCDRQNMLFTLKPENARNPDAVVQKIFSFAQDGSASIEESASIKPKLDRNLGNWEQKAFGRSRRPNKLKQSDNNTGF
jgi:Circadian oscillating protein COP23